MRLDKYIASCTGMSRKEIKKALKKNPALVDGVKTTEPGYQAAPDAQVFFQGAHLNYSEFTYILMNKPAGVVCSNREGESPTVFSLLDGVTVKNLFTVGRLDKDTTGLLLITNDGDFSHRLLSPGKHVDKTYFLTTDTAIPAGTVEKFKAGVDIGDDRFTKPAELNLLPDKKSAYLTISEGRYHQVKRMMETAGCCVTSLQRISMGAFTLDKKLPEGEWRHFTEEERSLVKGYKEAALP